MASGINDVGQIVGSFQHSSGTTHSFLYNPNGGTYTSVDAVAPDTEALGINDAGQIVGDYRDNTGAIHGFLLINGLHATIDDPLANPLSLGPNAFTIASGINNAGLVVGSFGILGTANHGFLYNPNGGTFTTLDDPLAGARGTVAYGINDAGEIVGSYYDASNRAHGFLYSGGTYITLDDPSAIGDTRAFSINDAGETVGSYFVGSGAHGFLLTITPDPPPPPGTTADMILRNGAGLYEIYDIGNNAILAGYQLGTVGNDWFFARTLGSSFAVSDLGAFNGSDTTDMLLRNRNTGGFELYDISNNNITGAASLGAVGLDWQVLGFGNFSSLGENDMVLRNVNTGGVEVYDISNNQLTGANFMGTVGLNWQLGGFGNFSSNPGESDMILRNTNTGGLELYDISNNQITGAAFLGTVGLDWHVVGFGPLNGPGTSDMVLRNVNTGAFEVYDIANNQLTGAAALGSVGLDWLVGGFAADPATGAIGSSGSASQLVQAMAGFGGSAADNSNTAPFGAETSQQPLLTTPQHA